jgi:hypothetical protein
VDYNKLRRAVVLALAYKVSSEPFEMDVVSAA